MKQAEQIRKEVAERPEAVPDLVAAETVLVAPVVTGEEALRVDKEDVRPAVDPADLADAREVADRKTYYHNLISN